MCATCGCGGDAATMHDLHDHARDHDHDHRHPHGHSHERDHAHAHSHGGIVELEARILAKNDALAQKNRGWFAGREILALNLLGAPGAGKTALIERTIAELGREAPIFVIEGDQASELDSERIRRAGALAVQLNTGTGCHLDAAMVAAALSELRPDPGAVVLIENVGNLVCPALFDLGEYAKVAILSVTEGEDKPLKYPHMFRAARVMILNKVDLLPYVRFDVGRCIGYARRVNPAIEVLQLSAETGAGLETWYAWLRHAIDRGGQARDEWASLSNGGANRAGAT